MATQRRTLECQALVAAQSIAFQEKTHRFASRMSRMPVSAIREILKVTEHPEIISFAGGLPAPELFPVAAIAQAYADVFASEGPAALQYSTTEGWRPLREWISGRMQKRGIDASADRVLITTGSQQGIDLVGKVFIERGDAVVVENPCYLAALQSFSAYEASFIAIDGDGEGMRVDQLEDALRYYRDGAHDKRFAVDAQTKLARVQAARGYYDDARQQIQAVLADAVATSNNLTIGLCHEDLGRVWLEAHSYENARSEFLLAIDYFTRSNSARPLARAQMYLGQTEDLLGNLTQAAAAYQKALPYFEKNPDYTNEAALRFGLGKLALQQGRLKEANESLERSIKLTEQLRENAWSKELRSSFLGLVHDRYQAYVELLMTRSVQEHDRRLEIRAFEASESGRARALIDSLHDLRELRQPSDPSLLLKEAELQKEEQRLIDGRAKLVSQAASEAGIAQLDKELREVRSNYEALEARINDQPRANYLLRPTPLVERNPALFWKGVSAALAVVLFLVLLAQLGLKT